MILEIFFVNKNIKIDAFLCIKKNNFFHKLEFTNVTIYSLASYEQASNNKILDFSPMVKEEYKPDTDPWRKKITYFFCLEGSPISESLSQFLVQQCQQLQKIMLKKLP